MMLPGNLLSSMSGNIDLAYNIADTINKIGFGLVVYSIAKGASAAKA